MNPAALIASAPSRRWRLHRAIAVLGVATLAACSGGIPRVSPAQAVAAQQRWPEMDAPRLEQARATYLVQCAACHALPRPGDVGAEKWPVVMRNMGRKAKLSAETSEDLLRWVLVARDVR